MKILITEQLSKNKYKDNSGYLICKDAIIARTGTQQYLSKELFTDGDDSIIVVDRPKEEVLNDKTIASFENKPVTDEHPDVDVVPLNCKHLQIGFARDIHPGKVDGTDVLLATLVITDADAIEMIENGEKVELSCGYDCDIMKDDNGNYYQANIRGNHIALCEAGRAGIARIVDSKIKDYSFSEHTSIGRIDNKEIYIERDDTHQCYSIWIGDLGYLKDFYSIDEAKQYFNSHKNEFTYSNLRKMHGLDSAIKDINYNLGSKLGISAADYAELYRNGQKVWSGELYTIEEYSDGYFDSDDIDTHFRKVSKNTFRYQNGRYNYELKVKDSMLKDAKTTITINAYIGTMLPNEKAEKLGLNQLEIKMIDHYGWGPQSKSVFEVKGPIEQVKKLLAAYRQSSNPINDNLPSNIQYTKRVIDNRTIFDLKVDGKYVASFDSFNTMIFYISKYSK